MTALRAALFAAAALVLGAAGADAQTPAAPAAVAPTAAPAAAVPASRPLPAGLHQSGGVIMMEPVTHRESAETGETVPQSSGNRRPGAVHALSAADHDLYTKAFDAADRGDWIAARGLADRGHDATARNLVIWRYLTDRNSGASFDEIDRFLRDHPDWPLRQTLFARAEHAMPATMDASAVIAWFGERKPVIGMGKVRLGEALIATGRNSEGRALIRKAWVENNFEPNEEISIAREHGDILTPEDDRERLNRLLWRDDLAAARREISRVDAQTQRLAQVRMALKTNPGAGERMAAQLPEMLSGDAGLIFDRARVLRRGSGGDGVPELLVKAPTRQMANIDPDNWWRDVHSAAREAIKDRSYRTAYRLVTNTKQHEGTNFAEAEFLAGWIALRFLHDPKTALEHFRRLADGVSRPISLGRAHYWEGRAYEAMSDEAMAYSEYKIAAGSPATFYGQLALARIEAAPRLYLKNTDGDPALARNAYEKDEVVRGIRVLADLGAENLLRLFATHCAEAHPDAGYVELLAHDLVQTGFREVAVRVAKTASYSNIVLLSYSHPVIALPSYPGPGAAPEEALVLGLIRQETEFYADAVSHAGAVGLMQLMPATARRTAQTAGLAYRPSALKTDPRYNVQLGMTELAGNLADWRGSYILATAAYNAGRTNVKKWIAAYGDPRDAGIDPIDWIEQIPFSETRNYVQRVIENTEVYRNRLAGRNEPLRILADLYRPKTPDVILLKYVPPPETPAAPLPANVPIPQARPNQARVQDPGGMKEKTSEEIAALSPAISRPSARPAIERHNRPQTEVSVTPSPRPSPAVKLKKKAVR